MKTTIAILSTALTIWTFITIVITCLFNSLVKKGIIKIKFDSEKPADSLIDELDEIIMEGKNGRK